MLTFPYWLRAPLGILILLSACVDQRDREGETSGAESILLIEETATFALPTGFAPSGLIVTSDSLIVGWSSSDSRIVVTDTAFSFTRLVEIPSTVVPRYIGLAPSGDFEVIPEYPAEIVTLSRTDASIVGKTHINYAYPVLAAMRHPDFWLIVAPSRRGHLALFRVAADSEQLLSEIATSAIGTLTLHEESLYYTEARTPFRIFRYDLDGQMDMTFRPQSKLEHGGGHHGPPVVVLDRGILQMITTENSDQTIMTVYDDTGAELTTKSMSLPLVMRGSVPDQSIAFGVRFVNDYEIVRYRWRWTDSR